MGIPKDELSTLLKYRSDSSQTSQELCDSILAFVVHKWKKEAEEIEAEEDAASQSEATEGEVELNQEVMKEFQLRIDGFKESNENSLTVLA